MRLGLARASIDLEEAIYFQPNDRRPPRKRGSFLSYFYHTLGEPLDLVGQALICLEKALPGRH